MKEFWKGNWPQLVAIFICILYIWGCEGHQPVPTKPAELKITITNLGRKGAGEKAKIEIKQGDKIHKSMEVPNPGMKLSQLSAITSTNKAFIKIFSGLSVADVTRTWNDLLYLENETNIREVNIFIDSPGGDAFSGLALADQIEVFKKKGFKFIAHATGIVASAAVPVFAVCDETHATEATIFMVHEAALWKWPGRETASDIRSQGKLMDLLQRLYLNKLVRHSNLKFDDWMLMEAKTSWFSVKKAKEIGILDHID
jgi:ATP-dependent protease ClpP protease subunit